MFNVVEEMVLQCDRTALAHSAHLLGCASPLNLGNQRGGPINQVLGVRLTHEGTSLNENSSVLGSSRLLSF